MSGEHSQGEWRVGGSERLVFSGAEPGGAILSALPLDNDPNAVRQKANARLAWAAPKLLKSLEEMLDVMDDGSDEPTLIDARAAVAEAKGETP